MKDSVFTAFFDESEAATVYFVGGWIATQDEWQEFSASWNRALSTEPAIDYFRYHDAKGVQGEFTGWSNDDVASRIDDFVKVICDHEMYAVISGLRTTTWKKSFESTTLSPKRLKRIFKFTHPYQPCFFGATAAVLQRQIEKGHSEVVDFVFDEQKGLLDESIESYEAFKLDFPAEQKAIAGSVIIGDDKKTPPLQAADLLCGLIATNLLTGKPTAAYQKLVACHEVVRFKSYPPNFQQIPDLIKIVELLWSEKKRLDRELLKPEEEPKKSAED